MDLRNRVYGNQRGERKRIAREVGITPTYLYMICVGTRRLDSVELAQKIAAATDGRIVWTELVPHTSLPAAS